ncbi:hypothetical protein pb186bvf_006104 [Paramecium bursaria]
MFNNLSPNRVSAQRARSPQHSYPDGFAVSLSQSIKLGQQPSKISPISNVIKGVPVPTYHQPFSRVYVRPPIQIIETIVPQQPIQVVDLRQYEEIWQKRLEDLQNKLSNQRPHSDDKVDELLVKIQELNSRQADLEDQKMLMMQLMNKRTNSQQVQNENQTLTKQLEDALKGKSDQKPIIQSNNSDEIKNLRLDLENSNKTLQNYREKSEQLLSEQQYLKDQLEEKDNRIEELEIEIEHFETDIENLNQQVDLWKEKFKQCNNDLNAAQEEVINLQTQIEVATKTKVTQSVIQTQSKKVIQSNNDRASEYEKSALDNNDIEKLKQLNLQ